VSRAAGASGLSRRTWLFATGTGLVIGVTYALSPLTVWFAVAAIALVRWAERDLSELERQWVRAILVIAIGVRVLALLGLFLTTDHARVPFGVFFGDEEFFIRRSMWLRSLALGLPLHGADLIYTFDDVGTTSYLYVLAFVQILVGPSPYGVHLLDMAFYLGATILLYRIVRPTLGRMPALIGLTVMLFLPSLFAWSISALKEPAFLLLTALGIAAVVGFVRTERWTARVAAVLVAAVVLAVVESVRRAGAAIAVLFGGAIAAWIAKRPRVLLAGIALTPIVLGWVAARPSVQMAAYRVVTQAGWQQAGHINTPGYVYKTLDDRFYENTSLIDEMRPFETARFLSRSVWAYLTVPLPWDIQSRSALAYTPEQIVWYILVALAPVGVWFSFKRDALVTCLLMAHAVVAALLVAITSGNVGTLVRHRGMALPYFVWVSAVGACELLTRLSRAARRVPAGLSSASSHAS
jgi:hypothetical protein